MPPWLPRILVFLLIPCLLADPSGRRDQAQETLFNVAALSLPVSTVGNTPYKVFESQLATAARQRPRQQAGRVKPSMLWTALVLSVILHVAAAWRFSEIKEELGVLKSWAITTPALGRSRITGLERPRLFDLSHVTRLGVTLPEEARGKNFEIVFLDRFGVKQSQRRFFSEGRRENPYLEFTLDPFPGMEACSIKFLLMPAPVRAKVITDRGEMDITPLLGMTVQLKNAEKLEILFNEAAKPEMPVKIVITTEDNVELVSHSTPLDGNLRLSMNIKDLITIPRSKINFLYPAPPEFVPLWIEIQKKKSPDAPKPQEKPLRSSV